jgi:deoxycytidine triphosphate deaminase
MIDTPQQALRYNQNKPNLSFLLSASNVIQGIGNKKSPIIGLSDTPTQKDIYVKVKVTLADGCHLHPNAFIKAEVAEQFMIPGRVSGWSGTVIPELCKFIRKTLILRSELLIGQIHFFGLVG